MITTKVGEKGRHVQLPVGWTRVYDKAMIGDRFLNATLFSQSGKIVWVCVTQEDIDDTGPFAYDCLIRKVN